MQARLAYPVPRVLGTATESLPGSLDVLLVEHAARLGAEDPALDLWPAPRNLGLPSYSRATNSSFFPRHRHLQSGSSGTAGQRNASA